MEQYGLFGSLPVSLEFGSLVIGNGDAKVSSGRKFSFLSDSYTQHHRL